MKEHQQRKDLEEAEQLLRRTLRRCSEKVRRGRKFKVVKATLFDYGMRECGGEVIFYVNDVIDLTLLLKSEQWREFLSKSGGRVVDALVRIGKSKSSVVRVYVA